MMSLVLACGDGESTACEDAEDVAEQIRTAAAEDNLSARGICVLAENGELEVSAERAEDYRTACEKHEKLTAECNED
jgi:hypothetical protein